MQKGKVINFGKFNSVYKHFKENKTIIIVSVIFLVSFSVMLSLYGKSDYFHNKGEELLTNFIAERSDTVFLKTAVHSFLSSVLYIALCFVFGSSMFGVVFIPFVVALSGARQGLIAAFLYGNYSFTGIAFHAVAVLPASLFFIIALLLSSVYGIGFSLKAAGITFYKDKPVSLYEPFKAYCIKTVSVSVLILLSAIIDALISVNFVGKFNL